MRKYIFMLLITAVIPKLAEAQVGIQTEKPVQLLHIDAARNNNNAIPTTPAQKQDDVVVTEDGNMGIGITEPTHKLEINGSIKIADGTQQDSYVLASDANGIASWVNRSIFSETNKYSEWTLGMMGSQYFSFSASDDGNDLTGDSNVSAITNEVGLVAVGNYGVQVPEGKYLVLLNGDIDGKSEYCQLQVIEQGDTPDDDIILYRSYYSEWLGGATFALELEADTVLKLRWFDWPTNGIYYAHAPYTSRYWYTLTFIQLSD